MKKSFRKWALKELKKAKRLKYQDKRVLNNIKELIKKENAKNILAYIPLSTEVNILPLIKFLRAKGINVYVPFMEGKSFWLVKYRLPLYKRYFGIKEPKFSKQYRVRDIDLAIIPIVGLDSNCRRIGFGKGMYDRFFEKEGKYIKKILFLQRVILFSPKKITKRHDIRADLIFGSKLRVWTQNSSYAKAS
jgi:5-formyltetrahydrofolate cyclo-ligase